MPDIHRSQSLRQLGEILHARLVHPTELELRAVNTIQDAEADELCFLTDMKFCDALRSSRAGAVLTPAEIPDCSMPQLCVEDIHKALIAALKEFAPPLTRFEGIHPSATVEPDARIAASAAIGPGAYIGHEVQIGDNTQIGPNCSIGQRSRIGANCRLDSSVVIYHDCQIGNFCIIHANTTIGATGFGYSFIDGQHQLIPHNGGVILEDGVEVGANTCIDRAKFGNTIIGAGTKIDNLVQIAHNVKTGKLCLMAGQVGIAGSAKIGNGVVFAGCAGSVDNVTIGDGVILGAKAIARSDIEPGKKVWGDPSQDLRAELKCVSLYQKLPELAKELKTLAKRLEKLESTENH